MLYLKVGILIVLFCGSVFAATLAPSLIASISEPDDIHLQHVHFKKKHKLFEKKQSDVFEDAHFWHRVGLIQLKKAIQFARKSKETAFQRKAKNVIIFVGDGMGLTTITAGRIYKGQRLYYHNGEEAMLVFDEFPHTGLAKTYNVDKQVPDSASTATAMFTGVKTHSGALGMDITRSETDGTKGRLSSIMDWAQAEGKRTGIVTTTRITHATPAATYASVYHRYWECDTSVPTKSIGKHIDIAAQLVQNVPGNQFNVIMGGGLSPMGSRNPNENSTERVCSRGDNRNLIKEWLKSGNNTKERVFVQTREELFKLQTNKVDHVIGVFKNSHLSYSLEEKRSEPSLREMTEAAIKVLERGDDSNGFVLMVEGGRIDQAHHQNYARSAMQEVFEFDMAIEAALNLTNSDETLIIVTADHSHSVTFNGYPKRGADILGFAHEKNVTSMYETISYANGPGFYDHVSNVTSSAFVWRPLESFSTEQRMSPTYRHTANFPLPQETHSGEDVIVFANGPGSSLIHGVFEQNYLAYVMSYAGCMGPAKHFDKSCEQVKSSSSSRGFSLLLILISSMNLFVAVR